MDQQPVNLSETSTNPWQMRHEIGWHAALLETIKAAVFHPTSFFKSLDIKTPIYESFYFYSFITVILTILLQLIRVIITNWVPQLAQMPQYGALGWKILFIIPLTIITIVCIFLIAAVMHIPVMIFKGQGGYRGTFHVLAYSSAATIFSLIPVIGFIISAIWYIVVMIKGYKQVHQFSSGKAVMAYFFIPLLVFTLALAAAIAIPNLLRAKLKANDHFLNTTAMKLKDLNVQQGSAPTKWTTTTTVHKSDGTKSTNVKQEYISFPKQIVNSAPAGLKISGIHYSKDNPRVLINDNSYTINSPILGGKITDIASDKITVEYATGKKEYRVGDTIVDEKKGE